jgi:hypothetical protein
VQLLLVAWCCPSIRHSELVSCSQPSFAGQGNSDVSKASHMPGSQLPNPVGLAGVQQSMPNALLVAVSAIQPEAAVAVGEVQH